MSLNPQEQLPKKRHLGSLLWDFTCAVSLIGIWPRFIEPQWLEVTKTSISIPRLHPTLQGLRILQLSDLHLDENTSPSFLQQVLESAQALNPDIVVFTGDFLCYARMKDATSLLRFLNAFNPLYGCYAVLGNHDYEEYVGINADGEYDLVAPAQTTATRMWKRLCVKKKLAGRHARRLRQLEPNADLLALLQNSPFQLLRNSTQQIAIQDTAINLCGLGEYTANDLRPQQAFRDYDRRYPGVVLAHNPDAIPLLAQYPGELLLCGHTHGGQINLPFFVDRISLVEHPEYRRGRFQEGSRTIYVNRGLGSAVRIRWGARPELSLFTLERA